MGMNKILAWITFVCLVVFVGAPGVCGAESNETILKEAESKLRGIYEQREYQVKQFRADWLDDSSGYTVMEPADGGGERVKVRYDAESGKRTVLDRRDALPPEAL